MELIYLFFSLCIKNPVDGWHVTFVWFVVTQKVLDMERFINTYNNVTICTLRVYVVVCAFFFSKCAGYSTHVKLCERLWYTVSFQCFPSRVKQLFKKLLARFVHDEKYVYIQKLPAVLNITLMGTCLLGHIGYGVTAKLLLLSCTLRK